MATDHSKSYRQLSLVNLWHRKRLGDIFSALDALLRGRPVGSYCDFGCSNGYITAKVAARFQVDRVTGIDHTAENLNQARSNHPGLDFRRQNLNQRHENETTFDLVTCFETLEHVGNLEAATENVVSAMARGGAGLLTVPIEIGPLGVLKYAAKIGFYRYSLEELGVSRTTYLRALLKGERMSALRPAGRDGFATHFGFDYREVDDVLRKLGVGFTATNKGISRFYVIKP